MWCFCSLREELFVRFEVRLENSAYKHIVSEPFGSKKETDPLFVLRNEEFALQCIIRSDEEFLLVRGRNTDIARKGLGHRFRVELRVLSSCEDSKLEEAFFLHLMDFVRDDEGRLISDVLTDKDSIYSVHREQGVFVGGKIPVDFEGSECGLELKVFYTEGYEAESLVWSKILPVSVGEFALEDIKNTDFYMDLWQHPCNWARVYEVSYYGPEHLHIIDKYFEELSKLGQKVCDLIISDYPWAGQRCYGVQENSNNLFESNIVKVSRGVDGELLCDFSAMEAYLSLAQKHGMAEEINLFGILGNWDARDFGNPLVDFRDPIRVSYFDEGDGSYKYLGSANEVETYLKKVFSHLEQLGLWDKTLILSDEPADPDVFEETVSLLQRAAGQKQIHLKCAIHDQNFFERYSKHIKSLSLNTCELVSNVSHIDNLKRSVEEKGGTLTWYSCCFPDKMNIFLKSPLIESRLIGWFTYYMGLNGFLRWAYGVWPGNVYESASYKKEKWAAGDMFLVYPGKNHAPLPSLRLKNILYGIQDYLFLKAMEDRYGREKIFPGLEKLLGAKEEMSFVPPRSVDLHHSLDPKDYSEFKRGLMGEDSILGRISDCVVEMDEDAITALIDEALELGFSAEEIKDRGLSEGMLRVTKLFENKEYFVSEVIVCADTLNKGITYLKNKFEVSSSKGPKVVIGVVEGDLHEIGKNIVKIMFEAAGFDVIDMGLNVKAEDIVHKALDEEADVIGLSTMMTTTMVKMREVVELIRSTKEELLPKIIIGGGCISQKYAGEIGADGYSANAVEAVKLVKELTGGRDEDV